MKKQKKDPQAVTPKNDRLKIEGSFLDVLKVSGKRMKPVKQNPKKTD